VNNDSMTAWLRHMSLLYPSYRAMQYGCFYTILLTTDLTQILGVQVHQYADIIQPCSTW